MTAQIPLLERLMALLEEVQSLDTSSQRDSRMAATRRVEAELDRIEAAEVDSSTEAGREQVGLIAVVRSALRSERGEGSDSEWTDESLSKEHGYVTYATKQYWDDAYTGGKYGESFDWFGAWGVRAADGGPGLAEAVRPLVQKGDHILMLGCGNSNMSALMYKEGYQDIVNLDISEAVIEQMRRRYAHLDRMTWVAMDAAAMTTADHSFDLVVDKGMFDALFTGTGAKVKPVLAEVRRVLRPGGRLVSMSFKGGRIEDGADGFLHEPDPATGLAWSCRIVAVPVQGGDGGQYWIYSCDSN